MKITISLLLLFFSAQFTEAQEPAFFRVYNTHGKKVNKGSVFELSDTSLTLTRKNIFVETTVPEIDIIKSKRTTGHRIMITTLKVVGVAFFLAATAFSLSGDGPRNGTINSGGKKKSHDGNSKPSEKPPRPPKKYKVNADVEKWQEQRKLLFYQRV